MSKGWFLLRLGRGEDLSLFLRNWRLFESGSLLLGFFLSWLFIVLRDDLGLVF